MVAVESLIYGALTGFVLSFFIVYMWKYKVKKVMRTILGSHEKIITVYEDWEEQDIKIKIQMTEWTWELLNKEEWSNFMYQSWLSDLLFEASVDPLAKMKTYWYGEAAGPKLDPKKIDMLLDSNFSES
jgi:hypothetical protein